AELMAFTLASNFNLLFTITKLIADPCSAYPSCSLIISIPLLAVFVKISSNEADEFGEMKSIWQKLMSDGLLKCLMVIFLFSTVSVFTISTSGSLMGEAPIMPIINSLSFGAAFQSIYFVKLKMKAALRLYSLVF